MSAEQMRRDGISRLRTWAKPRQIGCAAVQFPLERPICERKTCAKKAGYQTPVGKLCFEHAIDFVNARAAIGGEA